MCDTPSPARSLSEQNARGQRKISDYFHSVNRAHASKRPGSPCQLVTTSSPAKRLKSNEEEGANNQTNPSTSLMDFETTEGDTVSYSLATETGESATDKMSAAVHVDTLSFVEKPNTVKVRDTSPRKVKASSPKASISDERKVGKYSLRSIYKDFNLDDTLSQEGDTMLHAFATETGEPTTNKVSAVARVDKLSLAEKPNTFEVNAKRVKAHPTKGNNFERRRGKHGKQLGKDSGVDAKLTKDNHHSVNWDRWLDSGDESAPENGNGESKVSSSARGTAGSMNLEFYRNKVRSVPDGDFIENILSTWKNDFKKLERHHGYIQWLFPLKEVGMNNMAQILQDDEAKAIREDTVLKERVLRAYKMMLGFYGLVLVDDEMGKVGPSDLFEKQMEHLNSSFHNNLRITRILKALGEFGFEHLKKPLVEFLIREAFLKDTLVNCRRSCVNFWIPALTNKEEQESLEKMVKNLEKRERRRTPRFCSNFP